MFLRKQAFRVYNSVFFSNKKTVISMATGNCNNNSEHSWNWYLVLQVWTVPSCKKTLISRCFGWMSVPLHRAIPTPHTWKSEILWPVELKCCATGSSGVLLRIRILRKCSLKRLLRFRSVSPMTLVLSEWHARSRRNLWTIAKLCSDGYSTSWRLIVALLIWVRRVGILVIVKKKNAPTLSRERIVANKYWRL